MDQSPQQQELNKIIPNPEVIQVGGKEVTINTMKVKQLSKVLKAIQPFATAFKTQGTLDVAGLVFNHSDQVVELVEVLTGQPKEFIEELGIDELVLLTGKLVEANLDFFIQKVLPLLSEAMERLGAGLPNAKDLQIPGQNSSST